MTSTQMLHSPVSMSKRSSMEGVIVVVLLLACCLIPSSAYPLCASNLEPPGPARANLTFCTAPEYAANGCCSAQDDTTLSTTFKSMNISDANCAAVVKQILCSRCDQYSADLYGLEISQPRSVPYLCTNGTTSYCSQVWSACANVNITNSIFQPGLQIFPNTSSKASAPLNTFYTSQASFCAGAAPQSVAGNFCFSGTPFVVPQASANYTPPAGICLEKVLNVSQAVGDSGHYYLNMVPHPDGSSRVFLSTQAGLVWLANVSKTASGQPFSVDFSTPFLNISSRTIVSDEIGMMGLVFHPNFVNNGRFFVSYDCDSRKHPDCVATCGCQLANGCNITQIGANACQYSAIVAEYSANATGSTPSAALSANPTEIRRIFSFGLPYNNHHAGGLWFGPTDKYLYYPLGDGGGAGDIWNNAQNKNLPLGKMMRLDVDNIPSAAQVTSLGLYGNYSIPSTNPFAGVNNTRGEIYALGLRNPWRCSFDSQRPTYFYCADVGQSDVEEVDLISKGGNYGWRVYEGTHVFKPTSTPGGSTNANSINAIMPIIEYTHASLPFKGSASITGGYVSYSTQDACAYGKYIYADFFGIMWAAAERPAYSGNYTVSSLPFTCTPNSPIQCNITSSGLQIGMIISYGEDNNADLYVLATTGLYRLVSPSHCNITCTATLALTPNSAPAGSNADPSFLSVLRNGILYVALAVVALVWS